MGDVYTNPPQSRNEAILNSIVEGTQYTDPPQSRIEDLLLEVKQVIEEGGHDESATRASIAPTESDSAHASKNIVVGEQFYLSDDKLYTATSAIAQNAAIIVYPTGNYNCRVSDSVTGQITSTQELIEDTVGYKVVNLFDEEYPDISPSSLHVVTLDVGAGTFTCKSDIPLNGSTANILFVAGDGSASTTTSANGVWKGQTRTFTAVDGKVSIKYRNEGGVDPNNYHVLVYNTDNMPVSEQKADNSVIAPTENGLNYSNAHVAGYRFMYNGVLRVVTSPNVSTSDAITDNNSASVDGLANILWEKQQLYNIDINDIKTVGVYAVAQGCTNMPDGLTYVTLEVLPRSGNSNTSTHAILQRVCNDGVIYQRAYKGSPLAWGSWYKFEGTIVTP